MTERFVYTSVAATSEEESRLRQPALTSGLFGFLGYAGQCQRIHACALEHGLPEIPGYYGYDFERHEFIRMPFEEQARA